MAWLEKAKQLPLGHKARVDCNKCGEGTNTNAMMISHSLKSYNGFCFACNNQPFEMKGTQTLQELSELKRINNESLRQPENERPTLPEDFTTNIPLEGRLWLYSNGITDILLRKHNIGYSKRLRRVIMPIYDSEGTLVWYQCRALLDGQVPKYLQPSGDKAGLLFQSTPADTNKASNSLVVVEDIMSAIRVGEVWDTISLLGTKADTDQLITLSKYDHVVTWLDSDKAGKRGSAGIRQALSILTETRDVCTEHDPKTYSRQQIERILCMT